MSLRIATKVDMMANKHERVTVTAVSVSPSPIRMQASRTVRPTKNPTTIAATQTKSLATFPQYRFCKAANSLPTTLEAEAAGAPGLGHEAPGGSSGALEDRRTPQQISHHPKPPQHPKQHATTYQEPEANEPDLEPANDNEPPTQLPGTQRSARLSLQTYPIQNSCRN